MASACGMERTSLRKTFADRMVYYRLTTAISSILSLSFQYQQSITSPLSYLVQALRHKTGAVQCFLYVVHPVAALKPTQPLISPRVCVIHT